jgi:hypothetical protein
MINFILTVVIIQRGKIIKKTFALKISSRLADMLHISFHLGYLNSISQILFINIFDIFMGDL